MESENETSLFSENTDAPTSNDKIKVSQNLFPIFKKNYKPEVNPLKSLQISLYESPASAAKRPRRSLLGKTETPGLCQMILDAGQKEIGPRLCIDCGLFYTPGDSQDEEEHRKAHRRLNNLFTITLPKEAVVLQSYLDGGNVILLSWGTKQKRISSRLKDFIAWVEAEVGGGGETLDINKRLFLYILPTKRKNEVRILGSAAVEIIDPTKVISYQIRMPELKISDDSVERENEISEEKTRVLLGITRLWTDKSYRRRKIASRLCDLLRFHSGIPGCVVQKDKLGILEPSDDGKAFMYKYTEGKGGIYTYKF